MADPVRCVTRRSLAAGHNVAVCEQMEGARQARGLVRRAVIRVMTSGTVVEETGLAEPDNHFLAHSVKPKTRMGWLPSMSRQRNIWSQRLQGKSACEALHAELARFHPAACLVSPP